MTDKTVLVIGIGNELRGDDRAGVDLARRLRGRAGEAGIEVREHQGEPTELLNAWHGADAVVLVDTMRSGAPPGTIRRFDASSEPLPGPLRGPSSSHAVALDHAIELGRVLERLPPRVIVFAVEGSTFDTGAGLSHELDAIGPALADAVMREASKLATG